MISHANTDPRDLGNINTLANQHVCRSATLTRVRLNLYCSEVAGNNAEYDYNYYPTRFVWLMSEPWVILNELRIP